MKMLSPIVMVISSALTGSAATFTVANTNDSGTGSFRQAILDSNTNATTNSITFNIPGIGLRVIKLLSGLPLIVQPVTIDGFTQPGASENTLSNGNNANWMIELDGVAAGPNRNGFDLFARYSTVRGLRIANFSGYGINVASDFCAVRGCFVYSNRFGGIQLDEADLTLIGGTDTGDRNVVSGNLGPGIILGDDGELNRIFGNLIGTDVTGTASFGNQGWGIHIASHFSDTRIGGTNSGEANVIAFNGFGGVWVDFFISWNNSIRGNRIFANGGLGIDLHFIGVSTNDLGDADIGANQLQNFPLITNAVVNTATTTIQGRLNSQSTTQYAIDFYVSTECDASGYGEAEFYFGTTDVMTDSNGNANFEVFIPANLQGRYLAATATDPAGNTSEFSPCLPAPLRLEFMDLFGGGPQLLLGNVDSSPVSAGRLPHLRIVATTNLSPPIVWASITNALELTNGSVRVQGLELTNGPRFFQSIESQ